MKPISFLTEEEKFKNCRSRSEFEQGTKKTPANQAIYTAGQNIPQSQRLLVQGKPLLCRHSGPIGPWCQKFLNSYLDLYRQGCH